MKTSDANSQGRKLESLDEAESPAQPDESGYLWLEMLAYGLALGAFAGWVISKL